MTKVSVVVPVYNVEQYLSRCLNSLVNQTLKDIEIICVDDGSSDTSLDILNVYAEKDARIKIVKQENLGVSVARNNGVGIATGEYLAFCDSDDWVSLDFYEKLYNTAINENADIAAGSMKRVRGKVQDKFYVFKKVYKSEDYIEKLTFCDILEHAYIWNKIYKLSKLKEFNLKFIEGLNYEDIPYTISVMYYLRKLVVVPDVYYYYFRREGSIVNSKDFLADRDKARRIAFDFMKDKGIEYERPKDKTIRFGFCGITLFKKTFRHCSKYAYVK